MADQDFVLISHSDANSQTTEEEMQKILQWLAPNEYTGEGSEYQKHVQAHVPQTGDWIFETNECMQWARSEEVGTLWIKGIPGSGKSVVAANLIKKLGERFHGPVLYFFFRNIVDAYSKPVFLVRDFLAQLLPHSTKIATLLNRLIPKHPEIGSVPVSELWGALVASLSDIMRAIIVVDALDEIDVDHRSFIIDTLLQIGQLKPNSIKLVVTSRPLSVFEKPSENTHTSILRLSGSLVDQDIATYVSYRLKDQHERELRQEEQAAIRSYLCDQEQHGLFLRARLMLDELLRTDEPVEKLLARSPASISHVYQDILHEYSTRVGVSKKIQQQVLEWVTHASRPLRLLEVADIFLSQGMFPDIHKAKAVIRACCGPLLEVLDNETLSVIHHSFTEFLLDTNRTDVGSLDTFPVLSSTESHIKLASACIDYFLKISSTFDKDTLFFVGGPRKKEYLLQFPFLQYAVQQLPYHTSRGTNTEHDQLAHRTLFNKLDILLQYESIELKTWLYFCADGPRTAMEGGAAIHIGSYLGLKNYVKYLIQHGVSCNATRPDGNTPIMSAASQGCAELVAILAKNGANIDAIDVFGLTPIHYAAVHNQGAVIDVLAKFGANQLPQKSSAEDMKIIGPHRYEPLPRRHARRFSPLFGGNLALKTTLGYTPIRFACEDGCTDAVTSLMRCMAPDQRSTVCLHWAVARGDSKTVSILLQYPEVANKVDEVDDYGNTPLILACRDMNPEIVKLLLEAGASISPVSCNNDGRKPYIQFGKKRRKTQTTYGITPLNAWAELSREMAPRDEVTLLDDMEKVATMLIEAGCDVDARSLEGFTPLHSWSEHFLQPAAVVKKFVSTLLDHGADPGATAEDGSTPLHKMNGREGEGHHEAISLLIKAGADINAVRSSDGKTPVLVLAGITHDVPDLKPLAEYGIDFKTADHDGNAILHFLMKKSVSKHAIEPWLDVCDAKATNKLGETCLFAASRQWPGRGIDKIIKQVVSRGVNLEAKNIFGRTALLEACCEGGNEHIRGLLKVGASAMARDNHGRICLHLLLAAQPSNLSARSRAEKEFCQIIKELISAGADPKAKDFSGNHLIHSAVCPEKNFMGRPNFNVTIKAAIKYGGNAKARNFAGKTALHLAVSERSGKGLIGEGLDLERVDLLLQTIIGQTLSVKDRDGATAAHLAAASSATVLFRLIFAGADIRAKDNRDRSLLHFAAANLSSTTGLLCEVYKKENWSVDAPDMHGRTPLHEAASTGNLEAVRFLLECDANPSMTDHIQRSPLHAAATFCQSSSITRSEKDFYDRGRESKEPGVAYHENSRRSQKVLGRCLEDELDQRNALDVVCALLHAGADRYLVDYLGYSAYDLALVNNKENISDFLGPLDHRSTAEDFASGAKIPDKLAQWWFSSESRNTPQIIKPLPLNVVERYRYLETAIYLGNTKLLESLLASNIDPREPGDSEDEFTIVHSVVCSGQISLMKTLIPYLGDINSISPPLLHVAVEREGSNLEMVKLLLENRADANSVFPNHKETREERYNNNRKSSSSGKFPTIREPHTVLHKLAVGWCWWYPKAISLLARNGADLEVTNAEDKTALHVAMSEDRRGFWRAQCVDALLSCGADVNKVCQKDGLTPLNLALKNGCGIGMVERLLKHGAKLDVGPNPPLISAIQGVDLKGTKLLLDAGANPNTTYGTEAKLPLQIAADAWVDSEGRLDGLTEIITLLLESGADPWASVTSSWFGETKIFHYFCFNNAPITPFIDRGINIETRDQIGFTPLHAACSYYGYIDQGGMPHWAACELIANGADVDAVNKFDNTPLHCTMYTESDVIEIFDDLLRNGASVTIQNDEGQTVLYYVLVHSEHENHRKVYLIQDLLDKGADPSLGRDGHATNLHVLAAMLADEVPFNNREDSGCFEELEAFYQQFIELGCDPEARDEDGNTPAFAFVVKSPGYNVLCNNDKGPLRLAYWTRYLEKCNLTAENDEGDNLLHALARRQESGDATGGADAGRLFKLLMDLGVDPKKENKAGVSPLDIAATCGKTGILAIFESAGQ